MFHIKEAKIVQVDKYSDIFTTPKLKINFW